MVVSILGQISPATHVFIYDHQSYVVGMNRCLNIYSVCVCVCKGILCIVNNRKFTRRFTVPLSAYVWSDTDTCMILFISLAYQWLSIQRFIVILQMGFLYAFSLEVYSNHQLTKWQQIEPEVTGVFKYLLCVIILYQSMFRFSDIYIFRFIYIYFFILLG